MSFQLSPCLKNENIFLFSSRLLEERLDVEYYKPSHYQDLQQLEASPYSLRKLDHVCSRIVDGPFGSAIKAGDYVENGIPFIRVADVTRGEGSINTDDLIFISEIAHKKICRSKVVPGDVVIAKTGATMGAASVIPETIVEANIRGDLGALTINVEYCSSEYLITYINTGIGQRLFWRLDSGGTRGRVVIGNLKKYPILIPPNKVQSTIVAKIDAAYEEKKQKEAEARQLLASIDNYLLAELGIKPPEAVENTLQSRIFTRQLCEVAGGRFDPSLYKPQYVDITNSIKNIKHEKLGRIVKFSNESWDQNSFFTDIFPYIEIGEIDLSIGEIKNISKVSINEAPSRAKMIVRGGDIIISTTRPSRGAIVRLDDGKEIYIASTGFSVIRKITNPDIDPMYLYYVLRQSISLKQMEQRSSGGNYPAITQDELACIIIPTPPIKKQLTIASYITKIHAQAKQLRQHAKIELEQAKKEVEAMILGEV